MATIVTIPRTSLVTPYSAMVGEISPSLHMCPTQLIMMAVRTVIIDLCQRGKVWCADLPDIELVPDQVNYELESPVDGAEVTDLLYGRAYEGDRNWRVGVVTAPQALRQYPQWPHTDSGDVRYVVPYETGTVWCAPPPAAAGSLRLRAVLRPTLAATAWDSDLYAEYRRLINHGVLHNLMTMPNRNWTDDKMAVYHGRQWSYLLAQAKARANQHYNIGDLSVEMNPAA
jgi:hypothetical protein